MVMTCRFYLWVILPMFISILTLKHIFMLNYMPKDAFAIFEKIFLYAKEGVALSNGRNLQTESNLEAKINKFT